MSLVRLFPVLAFVFASIGQASAQTLIAPDPAKPRQSFEGWGVSLCWWANGVGRWDAVNRARVATLIADPDSGLGYTLFRYNIGGGDTPAHAHMRVYGDIPGYKATETSAYDWTADAYQRQMISDLTTAAKGAPLAWEAFANSPPYWMTKSGCAAGSSDGSDNLKPEYFDDFADYLTEVVKKFRDSWGVEFRTVTPFNEPSARWWMANKNQEGCGFLNNQPQMVKLLGESLKAKGLATMISVSDENSIAEAITSLGKFDDSSLAFVSQVNAHSYNGKVRRKDFANAVALHGKRSWQSESGPLVWPGGNQMDVSLWMADVIIRDILDMRVNAWLDWQIIDGGVWGSIRADHEDQTAVPNKRYYMHANFSRFIRPGSTIIESGRDSVLAALVPGTQSLVLVILNATDNARNYSLDLSGFALSEPQVRVYRTSESEDLARSSDLVAGSGPVAFTAGARSINTLVARIPLVTALQSGKSLRPEALRRGGSALHGEGPGFRVLEDGRLRDARGRALKAPVAPNP